MSEAQGLEQALSLGRNWAALAGSQRLFLTCPVFEAVYEGTRGVGKTDALLVDFLRDVGKGHGNHWRGILFRRSYKALAEVEVKAHRLIPLAFPRAVFKRAEFKWVFPGGEELLFRHFERPSDYWSYHGHEYPWIGWDELTTWPTHDGYESMKSCVRSAVAAVAAIARVRATANPWGPGHGWVKAKFIDPATAGDVITSEFGFERVRIQGHWSENIPLLAAQPTYPKQLASLATSPEQRKAWLLGSWDIVAGGMFDDLWIAQRHILPPIARWKDPSSGKAGIPHSWKVDRAYDHGSSKPFSVGWYAESDGSEVEIDGRVRHFPPRSVIRFEEWYGWNGQPNKGLRMTDTEIGRGIAEREKEMPFVHSRIRRGPADSSIFHAEPGRKSVHAEISKAGPRFVQADKKPGSRVPGWGKCRRYLTAALMDPAEDPGFWVTENCDQFIRTIPILPRDERRLDDVDTETEDHIGDEWRYRLNSIKGGVSTSTHEV